MLKKYKQKYDTRNQQFVLTNMNGEVLHSDQTLFKIEKGSAIMALHPFFETIPAVFESGELKIDFYCVHLEIENALFIVDIKVVVEEDGLLLILSDFTEHYNAYQSVTQTRNESVIKTELTVLKNLELEERERFKNSFIQNFSHELRNPLTSIMAITDLLGDTALTAEQTHMLEFLKESNSNLRLMLEDTLSIGMIDAGKLEIQQKRFNLQHFFELIQFTYQTKSKKKNLKFIGLWDSNIPELIEGDRLRLFQIVTNLLDNALKYTANGSVSFEIQLNQKRANKASLRFLVSDTGMGISAENQKTIFQSFHRLSSKDNVRGVGLGLTIVEKLLVLMGSKIQLKSELGKGSTFYFDMSFTYPLFPKDNAEKRILKENSSQLFEGKSVVKPKYKILLVEDDEFVQTTLFKLLLETKQFQIDLAYDGALVLQEVVNKHYDLILMDVNLPNLSGIQITKLIRDFPFKNIKNIPIIGLTANAYQLNIDACLKAGMQTVLTKPFESEELLQTLYDSLR